MQFYSLSGAKSKLGRAPKWLRKPVGASFGFGGKLVSFDNKLHGEAAPQHGKRGATAGNVRLNVTQVVDNADLAASCDAFHMALSTGNLKDICQQKAESAISIHDAQIWTLMKIICFEKNAREMLLSHLGFDGASIEASAHAYVTSKSSAGVSSVFGADGGVGAADSADQYAAAEPSIRNALVVGNFSAAVDCCVQAGLMAEALLLAQCGEPDLWTKTQAIFFERFRNKRPFLNILHAVINSQLMELVIGSDLSRWRETLAIVNTYGKSEEFGELCEALAGRLVEEAKDPASATLCYMCANNVPKAISFWVDELKNANAFSGCMDTVALQMFIEKVVIYVESNKAADEAGGTRMATSNQMDIAAIQKLVPECSEYFAAYANLLASQGRLELAPGYLRGDTQDECILRDRLYHAGGPKPAGSRPPQFPFARVNVAAATQAANAIPSVVPVVASRTQTAIQRPVSATISPGGQGAKSGSFGNVQSPQQAAVAVTPQQPAPATDPALGGLPAGWLQLTDPSSGRTYYVNQATNQSQWEPPLPQPSPAPIINQASQAIPVQTAAVQAAVTHTVVSAVATQPVATVSHAIVHEHSAASTASSSANFGFMGALEQVIQGLFGSFRRYSN